jgi:GntR family transcriptional regulator, negative regulator for fad regulon and positive regulator of fabA
MDWKPMKKPAEMAESRLLEAILNGFFPINSLLPAERELAIQIGVTRPTLREALQRLARDGWLDIQQGKQTRVRDYWREGSLPVLSILARSPGTGTLALAGHLLELRLLIAPAYAMQAVQNAPGEIISMLEEYSSLQDDPGEFTRADWDFHSLLTQLSSNPIFHLLLNGFQEIYFLVGERYFSFLECRQHSRGFYHQFLVCAKDGDPSAAGSLTRKIMEESLALAKKMQVE